MIVERFNRKEHTSFAVALGLLVSCAVAGSLNAAPDLAPGARTADESHRSQVDEKPGAISETESLPALPRPSRAKPGDLPAIFSRAKPESVADLKIIERHLNKLVPRVSPAVVAVQIGGASGSGVVITEDGLVLTAAHVCDEPNRDARFTFPDGKTARGKTLGTDHEIDAGMMRITSEGSWPHVEMGDLDEARLGDWVLTLGHPGGFDPDRSLVVRLGRIIRLSPDAVQTDCTLSAGDSGGPLFDMRGRVIGIHSRISESTADNFHVPIRTYRDTWERLVKAESWGGGRRTPRPWIGASGVDDPAGCKLESVEEDTPASRAGLKVGDVITRINDSEIKDYSTLRRLISESKPGDELIVKLQRDDKEVSLTVKVESRRRRR